MRYQPALKKQRHFSFCNNPTLSWYYRRSISLFHLDPQCIYLLGTPISVSMCQYFNVWSESVRFSVSKHISCETVAVNVSVVLSIRVFIYFDTRKSVKENVVCCSSFSAKFPKRVIEISSVWSFKDAFLKLICC